MSTVIVDLSRTANLAARMAINALLNEVEGNYSAKMAILLSAAFTYMQVQSQRGDLALPAEVEPILSKRHDMTLGRFGLRPLTSDWAQTQFPKASRELVITLVENPDRVHVFLVYL